jgi:sugar phosphate isomerase/epimerase
MFHAAVSQLTAPRWELSEELPRLAARGFDALAVWRHKLSDLGPAESRRQLERFGVRVSSVQWAGGFTGGDGRTFEESVADAAEAIEWAAALNSPVVVLHSGCRGGHTRSHARRLLVEAVELLAPRAMHAGVRLAIKPLHRTTASRCSFLTRLVEALELVDILVERRQSHACVGLAIDLWHFGDDPDLGSLLPLLVDRTAIVQVADRIGLPTADHERLPAGRGTLPLEEVVAAFIDHGYRGDFELDPVGEAVEAAGYEAVLDELAATVEDWSRSLNVHQADAPPRLPAYRLRAAVARRSQASSQMVSPG